MSDINVVTLEGRLTRDPESVSLPSGARIVKFSMASNRKTKDGDKTVFMDVAVFGKAGEFVEQYVRKGRPVIVIGELYEDRWMDKTSGQQRSKIGITANKVEARGSVDAAKRTGNPQDRVEAPVDESEIPF